MFDEARGYPPPHTHTQLLGLCYGLNCVPIATQIHMLNSYPPILQDVVVFRDRVFKVTIKLKGGL